MEPNDSQIKQQSEQHLKELQKRRELEQRRADFYAQRQKQLEEERLQFEKARRDKKDRSMALKRTVDLIKRKRMLELANR